jgi:hypothetical protein
VKEISNIAYNWLLENNRAMTEPATPASETDPGAKTPTETPTETPTGGASSHELWGFSSAIMFLILIILVAFGIMFGINTISNLDNIKEDWANQRCSPLIMPFASVFGHNTKENFDFCMNKTFNTFSLPFIGSIGSIFSEFATFLQSIFNSINSLRQTIATLGGGINVIFQEFTDRISNFFFALKLSAIRMKMLFGRMYATLFSVMYMGMSGISGMTSFTNTYLFSFLDTFCFPGETLLIVKDTNEFEGYRMVPIKNIKIGDVLLPGHSVVTATFQFYSRGQEMVKLGSTTVSTNHYVFYGGKPIMAGDHPHAIRLGPWNSDDLLYCVNTSNHKIPVSYLKFMDYDETSEGDNDTFHLIDRRINGLTMKKQVKKDYAYKDSCFAIEEHAKIKTENGLYAAKDIKIGMKLSTGSEVVGLIRRQVSESCTLPNQIKVTPATLYWKAEANQWRRCGEDYEFVDKQDEWISFVVVPNSQIELEDGTRVRDYMELCSPDAEQYYTELLEK